VQESGNAGSSLGGVRFAGAATKADRGDGYSNEGDGSHCVRE